MDLNCCGFWSTAQSVCIGIELVCPSKQTNVNTKQHCWIILAHQRFVPEHLKPLPQHLFEMVWESRFLFHRFHLKLLIKSRLFDSSFCLYFLSVFYYCSFINNTNCQIFYLIFKSFHWVLEKNVHNKQSWMFVYCIWK